MGSISNLRSGESFKVIKQVARQAANENLTLGNTNQQVEKNKASEREISQIKQSFDTRYAENEKVEILVEGADGVAVIQSRTDKGINLSEMAQAGGALASYALELKPLDENGDNHINEDELYKSWGEQLGGSAMTVGAATLTAAGTGATIGGLGGTIIVPVAGTFVGAGGGAIGGGIIGGVGSLLWEGVQTVGFAMSDTKYFAPSWAR